LKNPSTTFHNSQFCFLPHILFTPPDEIGKREIQPNPQLDPAILPFGNALSACQVFS
jgi:hypothetical protein